MEKATKGSQGKAKVSEAVAIGIIDDALSALDDSAERSRVLEWACKKYGVEGGRVDSARLGGSASRSILQGDDSARGATESGRYGSKAISFIKRAKLAEEEVEKAFHIEGESSSLVISSVSGSGGTKVRHIAGLLGLLRLLTKDEAKFTDQEFRDALRQYDAYDQKNFSRQVKQNRDVLVPSATGFSVSAVGLELAVATIRA